MPSDVQAADVGPSWLDQLLGEPDDAIAHRFHTADELASSRLTTAQTQLHLVDITPPSALLDGLARYEALAPYRTRRGAIRARYSAATSAKSDAARTQAAADMEQLAADEQRDLFDAEGQVKVDAAHQAAPFAIGLGVLLVGVVVVVGVIYLGVKR